MKSNVTTEETPAERCVYSSSSFSSACFPGRDLSHQGVLSQLRPCAVTSCITSHLTFQPESIPRYLLTSRQSTFIMKTRDRRYIADETRGDERRTPRLFRRVVLRVLQVWKKMSRCQLFCRRTFPAFGGEAKKLICGWHWAASRHLSRWRAGL